MSDLVTLIAKEAIAPYNKGDVFTVSKKEADQLLDPKGVDADGKARYAKVEVYDPKVKAHAAALEAQRGKPTDPVTGQDVAESKVADIKEAPADEPEAKAEDAKPKK